MTPRPLNIAYPWSTDVTGRTSTAELQRHIAQMVMQLVLTSPGERIMRPGFGSGVAAALFEPASDVLISTLRYHLQSSLVQELGDVIEVQELSVDVADGSAGEIDVSVAYRVLESDRIDQTTVRVAT